MTTQRLWPNVDASGVSLTVYAEDGVTVMSPFGNDVTLVQEVEGGPEVLPAYYRKLVYNVGTLLTYDPLGLSGDPITIPPVTRVSAGLVSTTTSDLATLAGLGDGEVREVIVDGAPENTNITVQWNAGNADTADNGLTFGETAAGRWKTIYIGVKKGSMFGITLDGSAGDFARLDAFLASYKNSEINIQDFGILPDGENCSVKFWRLHTRVSPTLISGQNRMHKFYAPAGRYHWGKIWEDNPDWDTGTYGTPDWCIQPIEGFENELRIRGDGTFGGNAEKGDSAWDLDQRSAGTMFYATGGATLFGMELTPLNPTAYKFLNLRDMSVVSRGAGSACIKMAVSTGNPDATSGGLVLNHVMLGGADLGCKVMSYFAGRWRDVAIYGCDIGLQLGETAAGSAQPLTIQGLEVQRCGVAIDWCSANGVSIYGGMLQSNTTHHRFPADIGLGRNTVYDVYHESGKLIDCDPDANPGVFSMVRCPVGDSVDCTMYGNAWRFFDMSLPALNFGGVGTGSPQRLDGVQLRGCDFPSLQYVPGSWLTTHEFGANFVRNYLAVSGTHNLDYVGAGPHQQFQLTGNTTIVLPEAGRGWMLTLSFIQDGTGGRTVTFSAAGGATVKHTWSNAGNVAAAEATVVFQNMSDINNSTRWRQIAPQVGWY